MGDKDFQEKVILITGGASGLGRVLVDMFIEAGGKVAFTYLSSKEKAERILETYPNQTLALRADVSDFDRAEEVVSEVSRAYGRIDVLVNNAAKAHHAPMLTLSAEDFKYSINNTLLPVFNYSKLVIPLMINHGDGSIINIGSINGARGREGSAPYCAAKAGVVGLTKTIAKEHGKNNIRCNVVEPGFIDTEGQKNTSPLIKKLVLDECAIRRLSKPEEVGNLIMFLASEHAKNITGQVYRIDCGQYI